MPLTCGGTGLPPSAAGRSKTDKYSWRGLTFVDRIAKMIGRECRAVWKWDYSRAPDFYRLVVSDGRRTLDYQIAAEVLFNHDSEDFRKFCLKVLNECNRAFKPPA
jgi:hypothetical protein